MVWTVDSTTVTTDSTTATTDGSGGTGAVLAGAATDATSATGSLINFASVTLTAPLYTGTGGIFDPNLTWPFSIPVVGSVIQYDPTYITVLPDGEINSTSDNCSAEIQYNDGTNLNVVIVFLTSGMVGYADDTTTGSGNLSGNLVALAGAASSLTSAVGALTTGIRLAGAASDLTSAVGALTTAIQLAGAATDSSSASGVMLGASLGGAASDTSSASAVLTTQIAISAAVSDVVTATGALTTAILMAGVANNTSSAAGSIKTNVLMIGTGTDTVSAGGLLGSLLALSAAATNVTTAAGALSTQVAISAAASSSTLASAALSTAVQLSAQAQSTTEAGAALGVLQLSVYPSRIIRTSFIPAGLGAIAGPLPYGEFFADVGDVVLYGIDWDGWLANYWQCGANVPEDLVIRPRSPNGYAFSTVAGGQSGNTEPLWPNVLGQTVQDGSVTWTCVAIDNTSLFATVQSVQWVAPTGITVGGQEVSGQTAIGLLDATNAVSGTNYTVNVVTTMSDTEIKIGRIVLKVR